MSDRIEFELVSPEQLLVSQPVEMVVVPGGEGYYGVLFGHIPMITTVQPGVIEIYDEGGVIDRIFVAGGFAEVGRERCTVLVDQAIKVKDIGLADMQQTVKNLNEDLEDAETTADREAVEAKLVIAKAKLEAVERFSAPAQGH